MNDAKQSPDSKQGGAGLGPGPDSKQGPDSKDAVYARVALVGEPRSGKSAYLRRLTTGDFPVDVMHQAR